MKVKTKENRVHVTLTRQEAEDLNRLLVNVLPMNHAYGRAWRRETRLAVALGLKLWTEGVVPLHKSARSLSIARAKGSAV